ncbi:hypothetical protein, partial [Desulfuromonas sp. TF]|uniref:hypothetical protein n=1 Tax=Desulfuromonas sp. TF TaxID=1232410 RepID=UPI001D03D130
CGLTYNLDHERIEILCDLLRNYQGWVLAAMVSFFDPTWGAELAERIECDKSICGLTYNLDHERIEILCDLLRNYQGWASDGTGGF